MALEDLGPVVEGSRPPHQLGDQPGLAHAHLAEHGDQVAAVGRRGALVDRLEQGQLGLTTDHCGAVRQPADGRVRVLAEQLERRHRLGAALEAERSQGAELEAAHGGDGACGDDDLPGRAARLQSRGDVEHVAGHHAQLLGAAHLGDHHLAGVDPAVHLHGDAELRGELGVELGQPLPDGDRGAQGAGGVVLVGPGQPEDADHRVADELLDAAAGRLDLRPQRGEVRRHEVGEDLAVEVLAERGGVDQVQEDGADQPALLGRLCRGGGGRGRCCALGHRRAAAGAEARPGVEPAAAAGAGHRRHHLPAAGRAEARVAGDGRLAVRAGAHRAGRGRAARSTPGTLASPATRRVSGRPPTPPRLRPPGGRRPPRRPARRHAARRRCAGRCGAVGPGCHPGCARTGVRGWAGSNRRPG